MRTLTMIPARHAQRQRPGGRRALGVAARPGLTARARAVHRDTLPADYEHHKPFSPLIDAKAASELLGVPHTWLLAQARAGRIPHHRLGHYVRFNVHDLERWLEQTRIEPGASRIAAQAGVLRRGLPR
ncbi:MAG TPA: helix-turn-helix domain-containing protein [Solirubrobacteraceae bacterium]|nr:helix-turn-helix domain-containing protein [Solirubrobacteraceae bacterium]